MRRFEFSEGSSNKFWEIELNGSEFTVRWGKVGTAGQSQVKSFPTDAKAQTEHDKLVKEKVNKGYVEVAGGASSPVAAAPKPAPKPAVAAAPTVAPAVPTTPAAVPVAAPVVTPAVQSSAGDLEIPWTPEASQMVHPTRRFNPYPTHLDLEKAKASLQKAWNEIAPILSKIIGDSDVDLKDAVEAAKRRIPSAKLKVDSWSPPQDRLTEAVLYLLLNSPEQAKPECTDALMEQWFSVSAAFAIDCLLLIEAFSWEGDWGKARTLTRHPKTTTYRYFMFSNDFLRPTIRLRRLLASTDQKSWDDAWEYAKTLIPSSLLAENLIAYLFPDSGHADQMTNPGAYAALSLTDANKIVGIVKSGLNVRYRTTANWDEEGTYESSFYTWLALAGPGIAPALEHLMQPNWDGDLPKSAAEVASLIPSEGAMRALFNRLQDRRIVPAALASANRFPERAIEILASLQSSRNKAAGDAQILLSQVLRQDVPRYSQLAQSLSEANKRVVLALLEKLAPAAEASPEELPRILVNPPWITKKKAVAAKTVEGIKALPFQATVIWTEGQQQQWGSGLETPVKATDQKAVKQWLEQLGFDAALAPLALNETPELLALWEKVKAAEHRWKWEGYLTRLPENLSLRFWNELPPTCFYGDAEKMMASLYGLKALPGLLNRVSRNAEKLDLLTGFVHPDIGILAADVMTFRKKGKPLADRWLRAHPEAAVVGLLPAAIGKPGKARDAAENGLRLIAAHGNRSLILEVSQRYGNPLVVEAVEAVLATDPLDQIPNKIPKMPDFWNAERLSRPRLKGSGKVLPLTAVEAIGTMLSFSQLESPYGGIAIVKDLCTTESLGDFAWDLFYSWNFAGAPSKEGWAFRQLGTLGNDDCARKLSPLIRQWPGESQHARAVTGLDILAGIGTDVALMHLNGIAQKVKFKGLQEAAKEKIQFIAEARGLTPEELADRLVPDLGLDENGSMNLDFGPRQFQVGFDELLRPTVRGSDGKVIGDLPKPNKSDDAEKSAAAVESWKTLKKDVKALASQQLIRLEVAMCSRRRWETEVFRMFLAEHPLVRHLVRRLVWGHYAEDGALLHCFRMAEDGTFADSEDSTFELPDNGKVGVAHALEIPATEAAKFGQIFGDYEISQPFRQLGRETYALTEAERADTSLKRFEKLKVPTGKILGLDGRGWRRGPPQDAGLIWWFIRPIPIPGYEIHLHLDPGIAVGMVNEFPEQTLSSLTIVHTGAYSYGGSSGSLSFKELDPITASELLREMEGLRG